MTPELPLRDIHLPPEPSWWPPAPGWWLLAVLVIALVCIGIDLLQRRLRRQRHRRALLAEVDRVWTSHPEDDSGAAIVTCWSNLLRRACLRYRPELASREGIAWSRALGIGDVADGALARLLVDAPFRPSFSKRDAEALREPVREALRRLIDGERVDVEQVDAVVVDGGQHA